jgi:hypothetical protein
MANNPAGIKLGAASAGHDAGDCCGTHAKLRSARPTLAEVPLADLSFAVQLFTTGRKLPKTGSYELEASHTSTITKA